MPSTPRNPVPKSERVRLILEVRRAYQRFAELLQEYRDDSPRVRAAFIRTTRHLCLMNRALALVALESAGGATATWR